MKKMNQDEIVASLIRLKLKMINELENNTQTDAAYIRIIETVANLNIDVARGSLIA